MHTSFHPTRYIQQQTKKKRVQHTEKNKIFCNCIRNASQQHLVCFHIAMRVSNIQLWIMVLWGKKCYGSELHLYLWRISANQLADECVLIPEQAEQKKKQISYEIIRAQLKCLDKL